MKSSTNTTAIAIWMLGALNNMPYVIMLAAAKSISEGGTALVFLANIVPGLFVKISGPYWFHKVSYSKRIKAGSVLMSLSFLLVAWFSGESDVDEGGGGDGGDEEESGNRLGFNVIMQLFGVALCSIQGSMGEASLLAICGKIDSIMSDERDLNFCGESDDASQTNDNDDGGESSISSDNNKSQQQPEGENVCIATFSSGTGLAGVLGFAFVFFLTKVLLLTLARMLILSLIFPVLYWQIFNKYISEYETIDCDDELGIDRSTNSGEEFRALASSPLNANASTSIHNEENLGYDYSFDDRSSEGFRDHPQSETFSIDDEDISECNSVSPNSSPPHSISTHGMTPMERFELTLSLWPYMVPLFVVYFTEYSLQSGVWPAIGFPVDDEDARDSFYVISSWCYQAGVFISRSSGTFFTAPMWAIWLMPVLQAMNLIMFCLIASHHFWYIPSLLYVIAFYVGLLGGGVYVHGYKRINADMPRHVREFALSTTSMADDLGVAFADLCGLFIQ
eukprot:CAMPEP_0194120850 /NCGR_PEP_ID=MMETSP0150-20130528/44668_1 /TAXON_ID=122233 /ORGANISM="Chaetoceros debilis, Strain MM31A-1" /LENGTH=506 /DNA_ID=CAMNT_0038813047 /DNA_START=55 /DNA_END=1572 /DNA_ORIENTATION=+